MHLFKKAMHLFIVIIIVIIIFLRVLWPLDAYNEAGFIWTEAAAKLGVPQAQFHLCNKYLEGHGVEKNFENGIKWCEKSSEQGYWPSSLFLAGLYLLGGNNNAPKNYLKAVKYYKLSMEQHPKHLNAYDLLALLYEEGGYGLKQDEEKSKFYKKLSEHHK